VSSGVRLAADPVTAVFVVTYRDASGAGHRFEMEAIPEPHHARREARKEIALVHALQPGTLVIQQRRA
jgi:hypothetical protein